MRHLGSVMFTLKIKILNICFETMLYIISLMIEKILGNYQIFDKNVN